MKRITNTLFLAIIILLFANNQSFANKPFFPEDKPSNRFSYNLINEYGFFFSSNFGFSAIFVNSLKFNKTNDLLGLGFGYENIFLLGEQSIPFYLNYRHYFNTPKSVKPMINIGLGTRFCFWDYYDLEDNQNVRVQETGLALYSTVAAGFEVRHFCLSSGFFLRNTPVNQRFFGGVEIKVGFTF